MNRIIFGRLIPFDLEIDEEEFRRKASTISLELFSIGELCDARGILSQQSRPCFPFFFSVYVFCPNGSSGEMHLNRKHLKSCFFFYCSGFRSDGFWMKIHLVEIRDDFDVNKMKYNFEK